ncbi:hypothetical protein BJV74DRAFT_858371 [Russula compacta]|nr:hypothetical protein BJV74DRAFT_858371 [Russula compacta]
MAAKALAPSGRAGVSMADHSERDDDRRQWRQHRDSQASSASSASLASHLLPQPPQPPPPPPPPLPVFLALGARRACVPYTPAFQSIDLRVVRLLSAREKLAIRDAVSVLAGGLGLRGEMWSLRPER